MAVPVLMAGHGGVWVPNSLCCGVRVVSPVLGTGIVLHQESVVPSAFSLAAAVERLRGSATVVPGASSHLLYDYRAAVPVAFV